MKGWVYVITNKAMPGLVKVGYSSKDPELRAREFKHTNNPHPFLVEYELLIDEPYQIEQKTHRLLSAKRERKEWFKCTPEEAVAAIKQVAGNRAIAETYKRAERAKAEALFQQQLREKEAQQAKQELENRIQAKQFAIRQKYEKQFETIFPPRPFWNYWIGGSSFSLVGISIISPKGIEGGSFLLAAISGAILGLFLQNYFENRCKQSISYLSLGKQRDDELASVRASAEVDAKVEAFVRSHPNQAARYLRIVEEVVGNLRADVDYRKIAFATKIKMAVNCPKQNVVNMIRTSYPEITDKMAADIFDALDKEPGNIFRDALQVKKGEQLIGKYCARCGKLYSSLTCPACGS